MSFENIPPEIFEIIIFNIEPDYLLRAAGMLRCINKRFAEIIPPTRKLPGKKIKARYQALIYYVDEIKYNRINNFIELIMKKWHQCYITFPTRNIFIKWLLKQQFPRNIILKETDKYIGHLKYPSNKYNPHPTFIKNNKFICYNYGFYSVALPISKNDKDQNVWLINCKNDRLHPDFIESKNNLNNIISLNHDMFGYPACNLINLEIIDNNVIMNNVRYRNSHNYCHNLKHKK